MGRSSTIDATNLHTEVVNYKANNPTVSNTAIAQALGISKMHVGRILNGKVKSISHGTTWTDLEKITQKRREDAARAMKRYGVYSAVKDLLRDGYTREELPSEDTINRWLQDVPDSKIARTSKSNNRLQYWSERRPTTAQQRGLIDTASTVIAGDTITLLLYIDWYSRAAQIDMVHKSFARHLPWFLRRAFIATGGTPHTIQTDNGFGFIKPTHTGMSKAMSFALREGVERWEFIPVAEAQRNGKVERLVQTAKEFIESTTWASIKDAKIALAEWLHEYNTIRVHTELTKEHGGRRKGNWKTPSDLCSYCQPPTEEPKVNIKEAKNTASRWQIVYKRFVSSGCAVIPAPSCFIPISNQLSGRYVDIVINSDQINDKGHYCSIEYTEQIANDETGVMLMITHTIGTFEQLAPQIFPTYHAHPTFKPVPTDEQAILRAQMKHLKSKKPRPGWILPGITRKDIGKDWQLIEDTTAEILYDSRYSQDIDHLQEYAQ